MVKGQLDVVRPGLDGEQLIVTCEPGEFTGEVNLLSGRRSLVTGRMRTDGELLDVPPYAASEGLQVLVVEAYAPGGQAGSSSRIENYLGFPTGISGTALGKQANKVKRQERR